MKQFATEIQAIDPKDGKLKRWVGPPIPANTWEEAEDYCQKNGLGYCEVTGQLQVKGDGFQIVAKPNRKKPNGLPNSYA